MRKIYIFIIILIGALGFLVLGCAPQVEKFGEAPDAKGAKTAINSILANPQKYLDKEVLVEGVIDRECPGGCWMHVRDSSGGIMYVEMAGTSYAPIPQRTGRCVLVKGVVYQNEGNKSETKLFGKGLAIK